MRFGAFAIYKGNEFEVDELDDGKFELLSRGNPFEKLGFEKTSTSSVYSKIVKRKAIETAYIVETNARYKGHDFEVSSRRTSLEEKENKITIVGNSEKLAQELGMVLAERTFYEKSINIDEAEMIWEERKPIYGFHLPEGMKRLEIIKKK